MFLLMVLLGMTPAVLTEGVPGVPLAMVRLFLLLLGFLKLTLLQKRVNISLPG